MDFQTHQDQARQSTLKLVLLLALGLFAIIAATSAVLFIVLAYTTENVNPLGAIGIAAPVTAVGVIGTSLVKTSQLKGGGGAYVARSLGGRPVDFNTLEPDDRQLSNIVEEIAIASGMPVPEVYILDNEPGINAFAAGWSVDNSVIAVTRGTLNQLNRQELQGVIAHEFSHIQNGDVRVGTRIIGWVFGIAAITLLGQIVFRSALFSGVARRRGKDNNNSAMVLLAAGVALIAIGYIGIFFVKLIQAAVSRQREYLADASAVQFTRDPDGIAGALAKIGGMGANNQVQSPHATETSHLFFASAFSKGLSTHPPLKERIARLKPGWNGEFTAPAPVQQQTPPPLTSQPAQAQAPLGLPGLPNLPGLPAGGAFLAQPGNGPSNASNVPAPRYLPPVMDGPSDAHISYARQLIANIPNDLQQYLHTKHGAMQAVVGMLVTPNPDQRLHQLQVASDASGINSEALDYVSSAISNLDRSLHLPAVDMALHSVRQAPYETKEKLRETIVAIESARQEQDLFRWVLRRVVLRHLDGEYATGSTKKTVALSSLGGPATTALAIMSWFGGADQTVAEQAFTSALTVAGLAGPTLPPLQGLTYDLMDEALMALANLEQASRQRFVSAAAASVLHDGQTTAEEAELIRVVADAVGQPVPPLLPVTAAG